MAATCQSQGGPSRALRCGCGASLQGGRRGAGGYLGVTRAAGLGGGSGWCGWGAERPERGGRAPEPINELINELSCTPGRRLLPFFHPRFIFFSSPISFLAPCRAPRAGAERSAAQRPKALAGRLLQSAPEPPSPSPSLRAESQPGVRGGGWGCRKGLRCVCVGGSGPGCQGRGTPGPLSLGCQF